MTAAHHIQDAGYSLVELLVVLLLLSFITLAISGGFRFGSRIWETSESSVVAARQLETGQHVLRELIGSAVPKSKGEFIAFDGTPTEVVFEGLAPRAVAEGGLAKIDLTIEGRSGIPGIRVAITPLIARAREHVANLAIKTRNLRFAYLDASGSSPQWLSRWRDRAQLPAAVKLEAIAPPDNRSWPTFVARLPLDQPPDCIFDLVALACRRL